MKIDSVDQDLYGMKIDSVGQDLYGMKIDSVDQDTGFSRLYFLRRLCAHRCV